MADGSAQSPPVKMFSCWIKGGGGGGVLKEVEEIGSKYAVEVCFFFFLLFFNSYFMFLDSEIKFMGMTEGERPFMGCRERAYSNT